MSNDTATVITGTCAVQAGEGAWETFSERILPVLVGYVVDVDGEDFTFLGVESGNGDVDNLVLYPFREGDAGRQPATRADVPAEDLIRKPVTTVNLITIY